MGLSSAMDWWDEWKLRILVLCSLFVQFFLFFSGYVRRWYVLRRLRFLVWIAYIGGDALAIYALATLFNRQKQQATADGGGNDALELIWAPVLLIHLGGQLFISAYSLEDNELWKRHAITLVSQVTVALYVFCKWWSGEERLLQAAVLLFIVGIIKFGQKPWALRRASYGSVTSTYPPRRAEEEESSSRWRLLGKLCIAVCTCTDFRDIAAQLAEKLGRGVREEGTNYSLEEYVKKAQEHVKEGRKESDKAQREKLKEGEDLVWKDIYKMFLDLAAPYSVRLHYLQYFLNLDGENQHVVLRQWIDLQFLAIYTKVRSGRTCLGMCTILVLPSLPFASVVLFAKSDKDGYDKSDIMVTYILFFGTVVMELAPFFNGLLRQCFRRRCQASAWQEDMVSQHNILSFCARKKKPTTLMRLAAVGCLRDYINKHWYIWHEPAAQQISMLIRRHAEYGWKAYIRDPATYRRFSNFRGDHTLRKHQLLRDGGEQLGWSINLPFDECVLLWHISTDLCLHHHTNSSNNNPDTATPPSSSQTSHQAGAIESGSCRSNSEIISNYMIYLLFICPDMLMLGTRQDLFMVACGDIEIMIKDDDPPSSSPDKSGIAQRILRKQQGDDNLMFIPKAHKLARALIHLHEEERWEVIQGVWVEMLCYSASRCRGYEHAKSLAHGREYLTNVWLLWSCLGMETLPDKIHSPGPPEPDPAEEQDATAALV